MAFVQSTSVSALVTYSRLCTFLANRVMRLRFYIRIGVEYFPDVLLLYEEKKGKGVGKRHNQVIRITAYIAFASAPP